MELNLRLPEKFDPVFDADVRKDGINCQLRVPKQCIDVIANISYNFASFTDEANNTAVCK